MADKQAKLLAALKKRPSEDAPPPPLAPAEPGASDAKVYHRTMEARLAPRSSVNASLDLFNTY